MQRDLKPVISGSFILAKKVEGHFLQMKMEMQKSFSPKFGKFHLQMKVSKTADFITSTHFLK